MEKPVENLFMPVEKQTLAILGNKGYNGKKSFGREEIIMKYCTNCGKAVADEVKFCTGCGTKCLNTPAPVAEEIPVVAEIPAVEETPAVEEAPAQEEAPKNFCTNCGVELGDKKFCTQCGTPAAAAAVNAVPPIPEAIAKAAKEKKKKLSTGKLIALIAAGVVLLAGIIAGVLALLHYLSPEQKALRALEEMDYTQTIELVQENPDLMESDLLAQVLTERIAAIESDYIDYVISYDAAMEEMDHIRHTGVVNCHSAWYDAAAHIDLLESSRNNFAYAQNCFDKGDYMGAIYAYGQVSEDDSNYEEAQQMIEKSKQAYREWVLAEAESYAEDDNFDGAIECLNYGLYDLPNDQIFLDQIAQYESDKLDWQVNQVIEQAAYMADTGDLVGAIRFLREKMEVLPGLQEMYDNVVSMYNQATEAEVMRLYEQGLYLEADQLVKSALELEPDNGAYKEMQAMINEVKPVLLSEIKPDAGTVYEWNLGDPVGANGDHYSKSYNYLQLIHRTGNEGEKRSLKSEYVLAGKYRRFTATIAAHADSTAEGEGRIKIVADGNVLYTSPKFTNQTDVHTVDIDLTGVQNMSLEVYIEEGNALILADVMLWP